MTFEFMKQFSLCVLILMLSACASQEDKPVTLIPVEERSVPAEVDSDPTVTTGVAEQDDMTANVEVENKSIPQTTIQTNPAVIAMIDEAAMYARQGQGEKAANTLERAVRIQPENAVLWHRLAVIRLQQQRWQQAISLARKSNTLARQDVELKAANWEVIAQAYEGSGNRKKANEARKKKAELQQLLG